MHPVDLVAEPREQRGQHGQRAEHRQRNDDDRRHGERCERRVRGQEHPGHRDHHGHARDQHRAARRRRGCLQCRPLAASGSPFLAFPLQIEHRVVDADREADQEHDREDLIRHRQHLTRQCDQPERPDDGGQSQQQRDAGRHERSEGDHEDDQRDRERVEACLRQVVREQRVRLIDGAGVAELADEELGVRPLRLVDAIEHRRDLVDRCRPCRRGSRTRRVPRARSRRSGRCSPGSSGDCTFWTTSSAETPATTSSIAALNAGSLVRSESLWTRTLSPAGCLKPASRILSMRPDSPGPAVFGSMVLVPTAPPIANAPTTSASQPKVAVFQWSALQRPIRAARLCLGVIAVPPWLDDAMPRR